MAGALRSLQTLEAHMRALVVAVAMAALAIPAITEAADLDTGRHVVSGEPAFYGGGYYRGRGIYQDSGWAYEVPVYHDCRVRIIQTPYGINRIRRCL